MKQKGKIFAVLILGAVAIAVMFLFVAKNKNNSIVSDNADRAEVILREPKPQRVENGTVQAPELSSGSAAPSQSMQAIDPLPNALARITKKPFGIFITPKTSTVQPERFQGYHTAVDLETTPEEQNIDIPVKALCDGKLLMSRFASGYGGVAVQSCTLNGQAVTVIYGHINLASVAPKAGAEMKAGDFLANLGQGFTSQTDSERKHLHLGIHKGVSIDILGYVQSKSQLSGWLDPAKFLQ